MKWRLLNNNIRIYITSLLFWSRYNIRQYRRCQVLKNFFFCENRLKYFIILFKDASAFRRRIIVHPDRCVKFAFVLKRKNLQQCVHTIYYFTKKIGWLLRFDIEYNFRISLEVTLFLKLVENILFYFHDISINVDLSRNYTVYRHFSECILVRLGNTVPQH